MSNSEMADVKRRLAELERKEQVRSRREIKASERFRKFIDIARQAVMLLLGAIEDWGNIKRTIPSRKDRRK
jgi:hypothetical protein